MATFSRFFLAGKAFFGSYISLLIALAVLIFQQRKIITELVSRGTYFLYMYYLSHDERKYI